MSLPTQGSLNYLFIDKKVCFKWLLENGFFNQNPPLTCDSGSEMRLHFFNDKGPMWQCKERLEKCDCNNRKSRQRKSIKSGSLFFGHHFPINKIMMFIYMFLHRFPLTGYETWFGMSRKTVGKLIKDIYKVLETDMEINSIQIGGPGIIVELDESKFGKRKYHRGHRVEGVWVFGGVERTEERKCFLITVDDRTTETLGELIRQHVLPGSIIYTDCWASYSQIRQLPGFNYVHHTINHSLYFVHPDDRGCHTNSIEGTWNGIKINLRPRTRTRLLLPCRLVEFMWRRKNRDNLWEGMLNAIKDTNFYWLNEEEEDEEEDAEYYNTEEIEYETPFGSHNNTIPAIIPSRRVYDEIDSSSDSTSDSEHSEYIPDEEN